MSAAVTPFAEADVTASAGLGVDGLQADIRGRVTVIEASVPATASVSAIADLGGAIGNIEFNSSADLLLESLNGYLELFAEAGPFSTSKEICDWDGVDRSWELWNIEFDATYDAWQEFFGGE